MKKKSGLYIGARLGSVLDERGAGQGGESLSGAVNRIGDRYGEIVRRSLPDMMPAEWCLLADALNGVLHEPASQIALLPAEVEDHIQLEGSDHKWSVDGEALVERLRAMSYVERVAIVDVCERFWLISRSDKRPPEDLFHDIIG